MTELSAELLGAIINDDRKTARLNELLDQEAKNRQVLADAESARDAAEAKLSEARKTLAAAQAAQAEADALKAKLAEDQAKLGEMISALNAEKDAFNQIRQQVEDDLERRKEIVNAKATELSERERKLAEEEQAAEADAAVAHDLRERAEQLHAKVSAAIDEHQAAG